MTTTPGLLDFFTLEAGEYLETLDGVVSRAVERAPDANPLLQPARGLRGAATMARVAGIAEVAAAIERVARGLGTGSVTWSPALRGALVSAVDGLKILLRAVRDWGDAEQRRARALADELARYAPRPITGSLTPIAPPTGGLPYLATEVYGVAAALASVHDGQPGAATALLGRVRALRGVAAVRDVPLLGETLDAVERAAKRAEREAAPGEPVRGVLAASARILDALARALRAGDALIPPEGDVRAFHDAAGRLDEALAGEERIVPIDALFFADGGPTLVERAATPPTTVEQRLRLELGSQGERLRVAIEGTRAGAARGGDPASARRELRASVRALEGVAASFGAAGASAFFSGLLDDPALDSPDGAHRLERVSTVLAEPGGSPQALAERLHRAWSPARAPDAAGVPAAQPAGSPAPMPGGIPLESPEAARLATVPASPAASGPPTAAELAAGREPSHSAPSAGDPTSEPAGERSAPARPTPTGRELQALLQTSISGISAIEPSALAAEHAPAGAAPGAPSDDDVVPVESLVYRGRAALQRAQRLRDDLRKRGMPRHPVLDEIFDLIDLAAE